MCKDLFGIEAKIEASKLKNDLRVTFNISKYLSRKSPDRPVFEPAKSAIGAEIIENLKIACDLSTPGPYIPPEGMIYRCVGTDYINILKKYGLDDKWTIKLDRLYHAPRWDYMQILYLWDWTDTKIYVAEYGDCDDFGFIFKSHMAEFALINGVMLVVDWSGGHAYNMLFDIQLKDGSTDPMNPVVDTLKSKAIVLEPQSDEWEEVPLVVAGDYVPSFPKWREMRRVAGLKNGMYPLKNCDLIM